MLKDGTPFAAVPPEQEDQRYRERTLRNLQGQAQKLGAKLIIESDLQVT